jgi:hypothetical protein
MQMCRPLVGIFVFPLIGKYWREKCKICIRKKCNPGFVSAQALAIGDCHKARNALLLISVAHFAQRPPAQSSRL